MEALHVCLPRYEMLALPYLNKVLRTVRLRVEAHSSDSVDNTVLTVRI